MVCADAATGDSFTQQNAILTLDVAKGKWIQQITININLPISILNYSFTYATIFLSLRYNL